MWSERFFAAKTKSRQESWFLQQTLQAAKTAQTCSGEPSKKGLGLSCCNSCEKKPCQNQSLGNLWTWLISWTFSASHWLGPKTFLQKFYSIQTRSEDNGRNGDQTEAQTDHGEKIPAYVQCQIFSESCGDEPTAECSMVWCFFLRGSNLDPEFRLQGHNNQIQMVKCQYPVEIHLGLSR